VALGFYSAFEDRYRGSTALVQERLAVYEPLARCAGGPVLDLGCGRGEWLGLLRDWGIPARGVDLEPAMVAACQEQGLAVTAEDAVSAVRACPDGSLSLISALHLVEHLPFEALDALVRECLRALRPGGFLLMETPNAENLLVGAHEFYTDPTHQRPIPANLLRFLSEHHGFQRVDVLRLHALLDETQRINAGLLGALAGVSMDYAVVALAGEAPEATAVLDQLIQELRGVSLQEACAAYDRQHYEHLDQICARLDGLQEANAALQQALDQQLHQAWAQSQAHAEQILALRRSASWRITAPLRFLARRGKRLARHVVRRDAQGRISLALRPRRWLRQAIRPDDTARLPLLRDARDLWQVSESTPPK